MDAASSSSTCYYDVFLSFRGEDTRKTFTDHLYEALLQHGFRTFRDDDEMEKGENLKSELEKAITHSKISVIVLSKDYTSSTWCLDEVVMILEQRRMNRNHVVLPVFYDVDPSQIRKQTGKTAEAFARYEEKLEAETDSDEKIKLMEKIKRWRSALTEVADFIGLDLNDGHEAKFIQEIIKVIEDMLRQKILDVSPYKVGIESRAKVINMWVQDGSSNVTIRAICGMGGIGKTTIAKFVYNENYNSFEGSSFLANISEVSQQPNGLLCLQRQLLSDISRKKHGKINNVDEGIAQIQNLLCGKRVLLVLDDVEKKDQIYMVLGMQDWLFPGSKIIITTRHERLLKPHQICRVEKFGEEESIKLFSLHAFGNDHPMESYIEHTKRVVRICEGLPLALKVIGSSLSGKTEDEWVCELERLEAIPHRDIHTKLKTSFDSLQDDYDKRLFLHIACFFVGTHEDYVIKILEKCNLHAKIGVQILIDRCLLERDSHRVLKMHRLIQDMGRDIIRQESHEPGERSRLWHHEDVFNVLKNETGTEAVEGLAIDMRQVDETRNNAKKLQYEEFFDKSIFSYYFNSLKRRLTGQNDVYLRTDALTSMTRLKLLELNYVKLIGNYDNFPKGLLWLSWHGFPLDSVPCELALKNLVILDLRHSRLKQVWKKTPFLESLKILDMSYSERLERTPNFVGLPNLERLILRGCMSLVEVCESIGILEMLELLDLSDCKTLQKLPRNIQMLESLKTINMAGCNISGFPSEMRDMKSLDTVKQIVWSMVSTPRKGPQTLWASLPFSLRELNLSGCNLSDDSFPHNIGNMPSLNMLNLSNNPFRRLPNCIKSLTGLSFLDMHQCNRLQSLDLKGLELKGFNIDECSSLEKITSVDHVRNSLHVYNCSELDEVEGYFKRSPRKLFGMDIINNPLPHSFDQNIVKLEFGITNLIRESGEFSSASSYEKSEGSSISFTVPLLATHSIIQCLNVFCTYEKDYVAATEEFDIFSAFLLGDVIYVKIKNKTKDLTWIYIPSVCRVPAYEKDSWKWWSRWRFGNQLEGGDEITITFNTPSKYYTGKYYMIFEVKECGYKIEYQEEDEEEEEEEENGEGSTTIHKSHHHFPEFRLTTGEYLLSQHFKDKPDEDYWFPKHSKRCFDLI